MKNFERESSYKNSNRDKQYSDETRHTTEGRQSNDGDGGGKGKTSQRSQQADVSRKAATENRAAKAVSDGKHSLPSTATKPTVAPTASPNADLDDQQRDRTTTVGKGATRKPIVAVQPTLRTIDKAFIDASPTESQIETAIEVCHDWRREGRATQITTQSRFWGAMFNIPIDPDKDAEHSRNPSVTMCFNSKGKNSNVAFQLQLNPHKFSNTNTNQLIALWEELFRIGYKDVRTSARFSRVDEASDAPGLLDNLIFDRKASQTREHYFARTNRKGLIQTVYIGEESAACHGINYDRELAELFRNQQGEVSALNKDTATQILEQVKGLIRVESRRLLDPKLTYRELAELPSSFAEYNLFDLSRLKRKDRLDTALMYYVELVRLRGLHGAKHRYYELHGKSTESKRVIAGFEERLARTQQLGALFDSLPIKKFLSKIGARQH